MTIQFIFICVRPGDRCSNVTGQRATCFSELNDDQLVSCAETSRRLPQSRNGHPPESAANIPDTIGDCFARLEGDDQCCSSCIVSHYVCQVHPLLLATHRTKAPLERCGESQQPHRQLANHVTDVALTADNESLAELAPLLAVVLRLRHVATCLHATKGFRKSVTTGQSAFQNGVVWAWPQENPRKSNNRRA
jgi:hypothetical protein